MSVPTETFYRAFHEATMRISEQQAIDKLCKELDISQEGLMRCALRLYQLIHEKRKIGHYMAFVDGDGKRVEEPPMGCPALD